MVSNKAKYKNAKFLYRLGRVKNSFIPFLNILDNSIIFSLLARPLNIILRLFGIKKDISFLFRYKIYSRLFENNFQELLASKGTVLFPVFFESYNNFNLLTLGFSKYLRRKNLSSDFLVCDSAVPICQREHYRKQKQNSHFCTICWKGYEEIEHFTGMNTIYMSSLENNSIKKVLLNESKNINSILTLEECLTYEFEKIPFGDLTKNSILKYFLRGDFNGTLDEIKIFKKFLFATLKQYLLVERYIQNTPHLKYIVFHNGALSFGAVLVYLAKKYNLQFLTYETWIGSNSIITKTNNVVVNLNWEIEYKKYIQNFSLTPKIKSFVDNHFIQVEKGINMYALLNERYKAEPKFESQQYVCLFTNLTFDTSVIGRNHLFKNMEDWVLKVIDFWEKSEPKLKLLIRVHPGEIKLKTASTDFFAIKIKNHIKSDNILILDSTDQVNSYSLIENMKYGLVYTSTIGMEIAFRNKICIIAGEAFFRNNPFILYPKSEQEYFETLRKFNFLQKINPIDNSSLYPYIYFIYYKRTLRFDGIKLFTPNGEKNIYVPNSNMLVEVNKKNFNLIYEELINSEIAY